MTDLLRSLSLVTRSLNAEQFGLQVTGQNIANVNTPGYTRREVDFSSVAPVERLDAGGGVSIDGVRAARDRFIERRLFNELPAEARDSAVAQALGAVEVALGSAGGSLDQALTRFFDAFSRLASEPVSAIARQEVVREGQALSAAFRDMSGRLAAARRDADRSIAGSVDEIDAIVDQIASLNRGMAGADQGGRLQLQDEQAEAIKRLAALVDVNVLARADGGVDVTFGNGRPLVVGNTAFRVEAVAAPPDGFVELQTQGVNVTGEVSGGRVAGLVEVRDRLIPDYVDRLDTLAYSLAGAVNEAHGRGYDLDGNAGVALFENATLQAGAAAAIAFSATVAADPARVAISASPTAQGNELAREIAGLRDAPAVSSATFAETWANLVYRVGRDVQTAEQEQASHQGLVRQLEALRDSVSGISLDEEAMSMLKFQRAYEANARFFRVIDDSLDILMQTLAR